MIRLHSKEDINELLLLLKLNTPAYFHQSEEADFIYYLQNYSHHYFVVEKNNSIIGCGGINFFPEKKEARISWDIIHPDFQKMGVGSELTRFRILKIREYPGINTIRVRTTQLVFPFYEKVGFEMEKIEKDYWEKGFDL